MNLTQLYDAILNGKLEEGIAVTKTAIHEGTDPQIIINDYMVKAMEEIGARFESGKAFVPNLLMSARAMKGVLNLLKPLLTTGTTTSAGTIVIGTVKGDLHDIGKNLVASMLEGCGFEVINLGVDVSSDQFVEAARKHHADIVCMSALLTTTMNYMREVTAAIQASDLVLKPRVMVGGAPLTEAFATEIGADGYSSNANGAVILARVSGKGDAERVEAARRCRPQYAYRLFPTERIDPDSISAGGAKFATGHVITRYLKNAEYLAFFIATAGREFDAWLRELKTEDDILKEFLTDAIGSEIAEATARIMARRMSGTLAEKGMRISNSYSPGYCGWPVSDQQQLFELFPPQICGVELNSSSLMSPVKSVSGVIAVGSQVQKMPYGCAICGRKDCYKNRLKQKI